MILIFLIEMPQCFKETGQGLSLLIFLVCGLMFGVSE